MSKYEAVKAGLALIASMAGTTSKVAHPPRAPVYIVEICQLNGIQYQTIIRNFLEPVPTQDWERVCKAIKDAGLLPAQVLSRWPDLLTQSLPLLENIQSARNDGFKNPLRVLSSLPSMTKLDFKILRTATAALYSSGVQDAAARLEAYPLLINYANARQISIRTGELKAIGRMDATALIAENPHLLMVESTARLQELVFFLTDLEFKDPYDLFRVMPDLMFIKQGTLIKIFDKLNSIGLRNLNFIFMRVPGILHYIIDGTLAERFAKLKMAGVRDVTALVNLFPEALRDADQSSVRAYAHLENDWNLPPSIIVRSCTFPISGSALKSLKTAFHADGLTREEFAKLEVSARVAKYKRAVRKLARNDGVTNMSKAERLEYLRTEWNFDESYVATLTPAQIGGFVKRGKRVEAAGGSLRSIPQSLRNQLMTSPILVGRLVKAAVRYSAFGFNDTDRMVKAFPALRNYQTNVENLADNYLRKTWAIGIRQSEGFENESLAQRFERIFHIETTLGSFGVKPSALPRGVRDRLAATRKLPLLIRALKSPVGDFALNRMGLATGPSPGTDLTFAEFLRIIERLHALGVDDPVRLFADDPKLWNVRESLIQIWITRNHTLSSGDVAQVLSRSPEVLLTARTTAESDAADVERTGGESFATGETIPARLSLEHLTRDWGMARKPLRESNYEFLIRSHTRVVANYEALVSAGADPKLLSEQFKASCLKNLSVDQLTLPLDEAFPHLISRAKFLVRMGFANGNATMKAAPFLRKMSLAQIAAAVQRLTRKGRDPRLSAGHLPWIQLGLTDLDDLSDLVVPSRLSCDADLITSPND